MDNVFDKELEKALKSIYQELDSQELDAKNRALSNKLSVYYAHGASEKAANQLSIDQEALQQKQAIIDETIVANESIQKLIIAASAANKDAITTNSSVSTAAVNIQAAANALVDLSADVAAILAVAKSNDHGSKTQLLLDFAFQCTQRAAQEAENTTLQSLTTTIEAAQSKAALALEQANDLSGNVEQLVDNLSDSVSSLQTKVDTDIQNLAKAISNESAANGNFKTARENQKAIDFSEIFINDQANYDLKYHKIGSKGERFRVSFNEFDELREIIHDNKIEKQRVIEKYKILFVPKDAIVTFDMPTADSSENAYYIDRVGAPHYQMEFLTVSYRASLEESTLNPLTDLHEAAIDYAGNTLERGKPYVFYVYAIYTDEYYNEIETKGYLSSPSLAFTLTTELPSANQPVLNFFSHFDASYDPKKTSEAVRVIFNMKTDALQFQGLDLLDVIEFKAILFKEKDRYANLINQMTQVELDELFNIDEAHGVSEQAYLDAKSNYEKAVATGEGDKDGLKWAMVSAEIKYRQLTDRYKKQQLLIETLNEAKLSNFILDQDSLAQIPEGNTLRAKVIDDRYIKDLENKKDELTALMTVKQNALKRDLQSLANIHEQIRLKYEIVNKGKDFINKALERLKELQLEIVGLIDKMAIPFKFPLFFLKNKDLTELLILIEEIESEQIRKDAQEIKKLQKEIEEIEDVLNEELKNIQQLSNQEEELKADGKSLVKDIVVFEYRVTEVTDELKTIKELEIQDSVCFVAKKVSGDLVDNYGQALVKGQRYNALVYTALKPEQVEMNSKFSPTISSFSAATTFQLFQI